VSGQHLTRTTEYIVVLYQSIPNLKLKVETFGACLKAFSQKEEQLLGKGSSCCSRTVIFRRTTHYDKNQSKGCAFDVQICVNYFRNPFEWTYHSFGTKVVGDSPISIECGNTRTR